MTDDAKPAHPPPWRWVEDDRDGVVVVARLIDADGSPVISTAYDYDDGASIAIASPVVREQTRIAPELEALLRKHQFAASDSDGASGHCLECGGEGVHLDDCDLGGLLACLDAARKANP